MTQIVFKICLVLVFLISAQALVLGQDTITQQADLAHADNSSPADTFAVSDTLVPVNPIPRADHLYYMDDTTHWMIEIPLWVPGFSGSLAYGDIVIDTDNSGSGGDGGDGGDGDEGFLKGLFDSATKLDYFMVGKVSYSTHKWFIMADLFGGQIDNSVNFTHNNLNLLKTRIMLLTPRLAGGYQFLDRPLKQGKAGRLKSWSNLGVRFYYAELEFTLPDPIEPWDLHTSWFDPFIGLALRYDIYGFSLTSKFDVAFRGISSFDNWWSDTNLRYRVGPRFSVEAGWMMHRIARQKDLLNQDLNINVRLNGPMAGLSFHF
ncbi:MAG: hypothetical protein QNK35_12315 [Bacteroides sp.]|nr:hypothetical protein [Bacteroides sp.]